MRMESLLIMSLVVLSTGATKASEPGKPVTYRINLAPVGKARPQIEWDQANKVATVIGRVCLWWEEPDERSGRLLLLEIM